MQDLSLKILQVNRPGVSSMKQDYGDSKSAARRYLRFIQIFSLTVAAPLLKISSGYKRDQEEST